MRFWVFLGYQNSTSPKGWECDSAWFRHWRLGRSVPCIWEETVLYCGCIGKWNASILFESTCLWTGYVGFCRLFILLWTRYPLGGKVKGKRRRLLLFAFLVRFSSVKSKKFEIALFLLDLSNWQCIIENQNNQCGVTYADWLRVNNIYMKKK